MAHYCSNLYTFTGGMPMDVLYKRFTELMDHAEIDYDSIDCNPEKNTIVVSTESKWTCESIGNLKLIRMAKKLDLTFLNEFEELSFFEYGMHLVCPEKAIIHRLTKSMIVSIDKRKKSYYDSLNNALVATMPKKMKDLLFKYNLDKYAEPISTGDSQRNG